MPIPFNQDPTSPVYSTAFAPLRDYILREFGWPNVKVELKDEHLNQAGIFAMQKYLDYYGLEYAYERIDVTSDDNTIDIPSTIEKQNIADILFPHDVFSSAVGAGAITQSMEVGGTLFVVPYQNSLLNEFDIINYYMWAQKLEDIKTVLGIHQHWEIINNKIQLYPSHVRYTDVAILYGDIPSYDDLIQSPWIRDFAFNKAKQTLGNIYRKFSGFEAGGITFPDGNTLVAEADAKMTTMMEELKRDLQRPLGIEQM